MMKTNPKVIKYQILARPDEFVYSYSHWPVKDIDDVSFVHVVKDNPKTYSETVLLMRKDSLKKI